MSEYVAPLTDIDFVLRHVVGYDELASWEPFAHADLETSLGVLEECGRFMAEVVAPLNRVGDTQGARLDGHGSVVTPDGFKAAYRAFVDAGWNAVAMPPEFDGGGFPWVVGIAIQEMLTAANMGFSLCPLLTQGAIDALLHHGSSEQQAQWLPKMITGEWTGTMNLTEPQAGSDVGALTTKAVRQDDGTYRIFGQKIYITYGEQDLTEQIVHLVLARIPGSPPGTKGISCFIVPKYLPNADGSPGPKNDLTCVSIEHKLGIHASPTCVMQYGDRGEGAVGYLIGEENTGMRTMFVMMNNARLSVGLEGLAIGERAYQLARRYASDRLQGRTLDSDLPAGASNAIVDHPDVRRMLLTMRAYIEGLRCLHYSNAAAIDRSKHHPDPVERARWADRVALYTPISKGFGTDVGVEVASLGIQIHGGMGYVEETGAAQHWRDSRIAPIYEGTNGIQAADLVARKLPLRGGGAVRELLAEMRATVADLTGDLAPLAAPLGREVDALEQSSLWLAKHLAVSPNDALAGSSPYLRQFGLVVCGWLLATAALAASAEAHRAPGSCSHEVLEAKVAVARFYVTQLLPQASGLVGAVTAGADDLFAIPAGAL
jgi:alkylation response protein AidB-like acyl-CoA dehydrogenase